MPLRRKKTSTRSQAPSGKSDADGAMHSLEFVRASLASVQANILVADTDFNIIFANARALTTLRGLADEIRKAFHVEVDDIVGGSIHRNGRTSATGSSSAASRSMKMTRRRRRFGWRTAGN